MQWAPSLAFVHVCAKYGRAPFPLPLLPSGGDQRMTTVSVLPCGTRTVSL